MTTFNKGLSLWALYSQKESVLGICKNLLAQVVSFTFLYITTCIDYRQTPYIATPTITYTFLYINTCMVYNYKFLISQRRVC